LYRNILRFIFLSSALISNNSTAVSLNGYWIYGFEQSFFQTCNGHLYWMWTPPEFIGNYETEGYKNPVSVNGTILDPSPQKNMNSTLKEFKLTNIQHIKTPC